MSFRDGPKDQTRNLEVPGSTLSRRPGTTAAPSIINPDRPDLDGAESRAGNPRGDRDRGVEILGIDQIVAAELLAGLRKRAIGGQGLAFADPHGRRGRGRLQPVAGLEIAVLDDGLGERAIFL